jgi:anti-anti-sigma regulatory factor
MSYCVESISFMGQYTCGRVLMNYYFKQSEHLGIIIFQDYITLQREDELREALMISLDNVEHLLIYFQKLNEINDSFVQLLCSVYRYGKRANKRLTLIGSESDTLRKFIHESDCVDIPSCIDNCLDNCLWS